MRGRFRRTLERLNERGQQPSPNEGAAVEEWDQLLPCKHGAWPRARPRLGPGLAGSGCVMKGTLVRNATKWDHPHKLHMEGGFKTHDIDRQSSGRVSNL